MKRILTSGGIALLLAGSVISAGCRYPDLSTMKPAKEKLAVAIVGTKELAGSKEVLDYTQKALNESAVVFDIRTADDGAKARDALSALAANPDIDLIVTEDRYMEGVTELAKAHPGKKFGLIGTAPVPDSDGIRHVTVNREHQSFVAGFLLASVSPKEPVGVIAKTPRTAESPEFRGLLEGVHYAGSSVNPVVVTLDDATGPEGTVRLKTLPVRMFVLLDPVTSDQMSRLQESGKRFFPLHDVPKPYPGVVARPRPFFAEGVKEEVQALLNNSWQGKSSAAVTVSAFFDILRPEAFPPDLLNRAKGVEDGLRSGTILPENFLKPPGGEKKDIRKNSS